MPFLANFFGARWLGHGRATEAYFATVAAVYAAFLALLPHAAQDSSATRDLDAGSWVALPFGLVATLGFLGLVGNLKGWPWSRTARFLSAWFGAMIYVWYAWRFCSLGSPAAFGVPFAIAAVPYLLRVMIGWR